VLVSFEVEKGSTVTHSYYVTVPDEHIYPQEKLDDLIRSLNVNLAYGKSSDDWRWNQHKLKTPRDTNITFANSATEYSVRFDRPKDFYLIFTISPEGRSTGVNAMPTNFKLDPIDAKETKVAYCYYMGLAMEFKWFGDDPTSADAYAEWAQGLFAGLKKKLVQQSDD